MCRHSDLERLARMILAVPHSTPTDKTALEDICRERGSTPIQAQATLDEMIRLGYLTTMPGQMDLFCCGNYYPTDQAILVRRDWNAPIAARR